MRVGKRAKDFIATAALLVMGTGLLAVFNHHMGTDAEGNPNLDPGGRFVVKNGRAALSDKTKAALCKLEGFNPLKPSGTNAFRAEVSKPDGPE